jgi:hypothetical protein
LNEPELGPDAQVMAEARDTGAAGWRQRKGKRSFVEQHRADGFKSDPWK